MSKRTLIIIGIAIIALFAAYLSFKNDREAEPEPEVIEPEAEAEPKPEPEVIKPKKAKNEPIQEEPKAGSESAIVSE